MGSPPLVNQQAQFQVQPKKNILYLLAVPAGGYIDVSNVDIVILKPSVNATINGFQGGIPGQIIKFIGICGAGIKITLKEATGLNPLYNSPSADLEIPESTTEVRTYTNITSPTQTDVWYLDSSPYATGGVITNTVIDSFTNEVGADHIHFKIKAMEALNPGDIIRATGWNAGNNAAEVYKVSNAATQIAIGICHDTLAIGDFGLAVHDGFYEGLDTSTFAIGDILYPNNSGGLTNVKPAGTYQAVAFVLRVNLNNGAVLCDFGEPSSNVGTGTTGKIAKWTSSSTLGDSIITETGTNLAIGGTITSGTWNGTSIGKNYGGTGLSSGSFTGVTNERVFGYDGTSGSFFIIPSGADGQGLIYTGGVLGWGNPAPGSHVFATTTGLGPQHTTSGLTTGMILQATGATTARFQNPSIPASGITGGTISVPGPGTFPGGLYTFPNDVTISGTLTALLPWTSITGKPSYFPADLTNVSGILGTANGGTNNGTWPAMNSGEFLVTYDSTAGAQKLEYFPNGTNGQGIVMVSGAPAWGNPDPAPHVLATTTGLGTYHTVSGLTTGQILQATGATTARFQAPIIPASSVTGGTFGSSSYTFANDLTVTGILTATLPWTSITSKPSYFPADLTSVSGTLPIANGGTNQTSYAATGTGTRVLVYDQNFNKFDVAPPGTSGQFLRSSGTTGDVLWATPPNFTSGASGYAPASGGGTTNFLRADGNWAAPTISSISASSVTTGTFPGTTYTFADSLTVTSDLTVDTNLIKTDSTNNRVGINQSTPLYALDVTGTARVTGTTTLNNITYTWPATQAANQYLQTNGSGTLSWVTIPASGDVVGDDTTTTVQNIVAYNTTGGKNITELTGIQGDILYHNGTSWVKLGAGTNGQFLQTAGTGANPLWATPSATTADGYNYIVKPTSQDVTNAGLTNDNDFFFTVAANNRYMIDMEISVAGNNATGDITMDFNVSAGTMKGRGNCQNLTAADAIQNIIVTAAGVASTTAIVTGTAADLDTLIAVRLQYSFFASAAGTLRFRFGNSAAAAGRTSRVYKGSIMKWKNIT